MKIVVLGGTGLIGRKLTPLLEAAGHEVRTASASTGVNLLTGECLTEALQGTQITIDVTNSPSFEDTAVMSFFTQAAQHLMPAVRAAGVAHHIALSVVGASRMADSGYMRAKMAQEAAIANSGVPYTILRATQFFEFLDAIAWGSTQEGIVRAPIAWMQPVAADDVAATLADLVAAAPAGAVVELGGPDRMHMGEVLKQVVRASGDTKPVVEEAGALYFGARITDHLVPVGETPRIGRTRLTQWLANRTVQA